jgi:hypothetical protein
MSQANKPVAISYVDLLIQEWRIDERFPRIQSSVRKVLNELVGGALLSLRREPKLEVMVLPAGWRMPEDSLSPVTLNRLLSSHAATRPGSAAEKRVIVKMRRATEGCAGFHSVWAYFPIHRGRRLVQGLHPKPATRVLLVFNAAECDATPVKLLQGYLRDHLGHVLLYLRKPKARNECGDAYREWARSLRRDPQHRGTAC